MEELRCVAELLAERPRTGERLRRLGRTVALGREQHVPQRHLQEELLLRPCGRVRQRAEHLQPLGVVSRRLHEG